MHLTPTGQLARQLVQKPSITPDDAGCQELLAKRLNPLGFQCNHLRFNNVDNLWATRSSQPDQSISPVIIFAGHTDVVPTGPQQDWLCHPFSATIKDNYLYGRGAADMKGSIASFITACEQFITNHQNYTGTIGLLITSDEEGRAQYGTRAVVQTLQEQGQAIDYCIVGEPSSEQKLGDVIKIGRRGSLNGHLTIAGKQRHIAYPHLSDNLLHHILPALDALCSKVWDNGNENFDSTQFQISNLNGGVGAHNVAPGKVEVMFNFRFSPESTAQQLKQHCELILAQHNLNYKIQWDLVGLPFETKCGYFTDLVSEAIKENTYYMPRVSTSGGTSDGRFIAPTGAQIVELGPLNATIHQVNEHISLSDLDLLARCYETILQKLLL